MLKQRIDEIDILRGLTFLAIVMQHTLASYMYGSSITKASALTSAIILILVRYAVPMFIFITGLVLFYNYAENKFNSWEFFKKRGSQIFIPHFIWTCLYFLWVNRISGTPTTSLGYDIASMFKLTISGEGYYHLWFMVVIMQLYLLFPFFRLLILRDKTRATIILALGFVFHICLLWFYWYQVPLIYEYTQSPLLKTLLAFRDRIFISWLFYFILGGYAGLYADKLRIIIRNIKTVTIFVYLISFCFVFNGLTKTTYISPSGGYMLNNQFTGPLNYMMVVFIISSIILIYSLSQTLRIKFPAIIMALQTFGRYSFGCYFIHAFMLYYVNASVKTYFNWMGTILQVSIAFTACSVLSLLACYIINKITLPIENPLLGRVPV